MTPQLLLNAYQQATGFQISLSQTRQMSLTQLVQLGMTPEDVLAVIGELKKLMKQKPDIYPPSCLEFRNSIGDPDRFEERALTLRQRAKRVQSPKPQIPTQRGAFTVLADPVPPEPAKVDSTLIAEGFRTLANQIGRKAS